MPDYYIGLMSGTSMDGIDAALIDFSDKEPQLIHALSKPWSIDLRSNLLATRNLPDDAVKNLSVLDAEIGEIFASTTNELLNSAGLKANDIKAIGSHGQTIRHRPDAELPFSLQFGRADIIADKTGIKVIHDFRTADINAGGQGAPLAPAFHQAAFRNNDEYRLVLNIGGIANITLLPNDTHSDVTGFDTGPGNTLMDAWVHVKKNIKYDANGDIARTGTVNDDLLSSLLSDPYFQKLPPKSTGFEDFNLTWLANHNTQDLNFEDVLATLCELTVTSIAEAIKKCNQARSHVLVCGGGVHNHYLMERLRSHLSDCTVESTQALGVDPDYVEATAFAWLARQTMNNLPGNLPSVTGAKKEVVLGKLTNPH